ncbi:MAG: hypothetical protein RL685_211 [Pseudomonadota bacterium]|jgi:hypothetical protein
MKHHDELDERRRPRVASVAVFVLLIAACAPAARLGPEPNEPGTGTKEQGAAQHRAAAQVESARLERHKELYDPHAKQAVKRCDPGNPGQYPVTPICWMETVNPTDVHLSEVEEHRLRAVHHRKAARELQAVEVRACAGVADEDRDISPFSHRGDILGVNPLEEAPAKGKKRQLVGATIVFRAVHGLRAAELQRMVDCHLARNAAIGHDVAAAEMAHCPLTERGASARVRAVNGGFAVDVRAADADGARAIWRRARALAAEQ